MKRLLTISIFVSMVLAMWAEAPKLHTADLTSARGRYHRVTARRAGEQTPITENPAGESSIFSRTGSGYWEEDGWVEHDNYNELVGEIIQGEGDEVYIVNPLILFSNEFMRRNYVKGVRQGDRITVKLPQTLEAGDNEDWGEYAFNISRLEYRADAENPEMGTFYQVADEQNEMVFELDGGDWVMQNTDEYNIIGVVDHLGQWIGFGEYNNIFSPFTDPVYTIPEGAVAQEWEMLYGGNGHVVTVAQDGTDLYIKGIEPLFPEACIKGTIDGNKVTFPTGQYIGILDCFFLYFTSATIDESGELYYDPAAGAYVKPVNLTDALEAEYFAEDGVLITSQTVLSNYYKYFEDAIRRYDAPSFSRLPEERSYTPTNPSIFWLRPYNEEVKFAAIDFYVYPVSVDGYQFDKARVSYILYQDGKPLSFTSDGYYTVDEPISELPFDWFWAKDNWHSIKFWTDTPYVFESMGVQTIYTHTDGTRYESEIITEVPNAVKDITSAEVVGETYTTLLGAPVENPQPGIYLVTRRYADGTVQTLKEVVK